MEYCKDKQTHKLRISFTAEDILYKKILFKKTFPKPIPLSAEDGEVKRAETESKHISTKKLSHSTQGDRI